MLLDTENISFAKFLIHFQPFKGPKFPGEACPRTPLASECFHVQVNPISLRPSLHGSPHAHFPLSISDISFPIWTGYSENELAR